MRTFYVNKILTCSFQQLALSLSQYSPPSSAVIKILYQYLYGEYNVTFIGVKELANKRMWRYTQIILYCDLPSSKFRFKWIYYSGKWVSFIDEDFIITSMQTYFNLLESRENKHWFLLHLILIEEKPHLS